MYELLTGELPFITHDDSASTDDLASMDGSASTDSETDCAVSLDASAAVEVLHCVCPDSRVQWVKYQAMLQAQKSWVSTHSMAATSLQLHQSSACSILPVSLFNSPH